jgi:hypothetical protein
MTPHRQREKPAVEKEKVPGAAGWHAVGAGCELRRLVIYYLA